MFWLNFALILSAFYGLASSQPPENPIPISHVFEPVEKSSEGSNIVSFDVIDDQTFDYHFDTECKDCKCFLDPPVLSLKSLNSVPSTAKIIQSYVSSKKIYLIHATDSNEISYSVFDASSDTIQELKNSVNLKSYKEPEHIIYSPHEQAFVGFTQDILFINKLDNSGNVQETVYTHSQLGQIYDMVYAGGMLFIAKGDLGIEVLTFYEDLSGKHLEGYVLTIEDLELEEGSKITKLKLDLERKVLYAYEPNSASSFLSALDVNNRNEISLLKNYKLGFDNLIDFLPMNDHFHALYTHNNNYYYVLFASASEDRDADFQARKLWKIPTKLTKFIRNDDKLLIQGDKYVYLFRTNEFIGEHAETFVDIISRENDDDFFPIIKENEVRLAGINPEEITLSSINRGPNPSLHCGVFRKDYEQGKEKFRILVLKNDCPEKQSAEVPICIYLYEFDVRFFVDTFTPMKIDSPIPVDLYRFPSEENALTDASPDLNPPTPNDNKEEEEQTSNEPSPNEPPPDEPSETETNIEIETNVENEPSPTDPNIISDEPINPGPNITPDGGAGSPKPGADPNKSTPQDNPSIDIRKPDLIDPDAPYYDQVQNMYALVLIGIIVVTCFGCLIKCLCDFAKNQARTDSQFKHKQLEEEDSENPAGNNNSNEEQNSEIKV